MSGVVDRRMRIAAAVATFVALAASTGATAAPPWNVLAWGNTAGTCSNGTFVARTATEAEQNVECLRRGLEDIVGRVDYGRNVVVSALKPFNEGGWLVQITDVWRPQGVVAVSAHVIEPTGDRLQVETTAYEIVRVPRTLLRRPVPARAVLAVDRFAFNTIRLVAQPRLVIRGARVTLDARYSQHPVRLEPAGIALYARVDGGDWSAIQRQELAPNNHALFTVRPRVPTDYRVTATAGDGRILLAWSAPVRVAIRR